MKRIITILALCLLAAGCTPQLTELKNAYSALTSATVSPRAIDIAVNGYDAIAATATNYLKYCKVNRSTSICNDDYINIVIVNVRAGRVARNTAEQFLTDHPGQLGNQGILDAITTATNAINNIVKLYKGS